MRYFLAFAFALLGFVAPHVATAQDTLATPRPGMVVFNQNMCPSENLDRIHELSDSFFGPILNELVDEGRLMGWGELEHAWGDEWNYNVYFAVADHRAFLDFFDEFVRRTEERHPGRLEELGRLCTAHKDNLYTARTIR